MSSQSELNKAYNRARRNALARMKTAEKKYGYVFEDILPDKPKKITEASIRRLEKYTVDYVRQKYVQSPIEQELDERRMERERYKDDNTHFEDYDYDYSQYDNTTETSGHFATYYADTDTGEVFPVSRKEFLLNKLFSYSNQFENSAIGERWNDIVAEAVESRGEWEVAKILDDPENEEMIENIFTEIHESYEDKPSHPRVAVLFGRLFTTLQIEVPLEFVEEFIEDNDYDGDYNTSGEMGEYDGRFR